MEKNIVFEGTSKKGNHLMIRHMGADDTAIMRDYMNIISQEQTYVRYQGEVITMEEEQAYVDDFLKAMHEHRAIKLLAFSNDRLIGIADVHTFNRVEKHIGIFGITVDKEFRAEGIGSLLISHTLEETKKTLPQLRIVILSVFANNPVAVSLYKKFGFVEYGLLPEGVKHKDQFVDHIYMYKKV